MHKFALALMSFAVGFAGHAADAPTIYRCGATYSQTPCAGGKPVDTDDARSAREVADARERAARNQRQADRMEHDRLRQESMFKPALATGFDSRSAPLVLPRVADKTSKKKPHRLARNAAADDPGVAATTRVSRRRRPVAVSRQRPEAILHR